MFLHTSSFIAYFPLNVNIYLYYTFLLQKYSVLVAYYIPFSIQPFNEFHILFIRKKVENMTQGLITLLLTVWLFFKITLTQHFVN